MGWLTSLRNRLARIIAAPHERPAGIDRDLHTLDFWREKLSSPSRTIDCRELRLLGYDSEDAVISGPGRIEIRSETEIRFFCMGRLRIRNWPSGNISQRSKSHMRLWSSSDCSLPTIRAPNGPADIPMSTSSPIMIEAGPSPANYNRL